MYLWIYGDISSNRKVTFNIGFTVKRWSKFQSSFIWPQPFLMNITVPLRFFIFSLISGGKKEHDQKSIKILKSSNPFLTNSCSLLSIPDNARYKALNWILQFSCTRTLSFIASLKKFESVAKGWVPEQFKSTKEKLQYILLLSKILLEIDIFRKIHWL